MKIFYQPPPNRNEKYQVPPNFNKNSKMEHCSLDQLLLHCKDIKISECLSKLTWKGTKLQRCLFTKMNKDTLCDSLIFIAETLAASKDLQQLIPLWVLLQDWMQRKTHQKSPSFKEQNRRLWQPAFFMAETSPGTDRQARHDKPPNPAGTQPVSTEARSNLESESTSTNYTSTTAQVEDHKQSVKKPQTFQRNSKKSTVYPSQCVTGTVPKVLQIKSVILNLP